MSDDYGTNDQLSSSGMNTQFDQGPAGGAGPATFDQGQGTGGAYDQLQNSQSDDMGGGRAATGSGVAGGYENQQQQQSLPTGGQTGQGSQATGEKADWLDKGITSIGNKFGVNVSEQNADKAGDFMNKEFTSKMGRGMPGVQ